MSLYEFCDFFLLDMCVQLFVLRLFFLMYIAFVLFLKRFVSVFNFLFLPGAPAITLVAVAFC